MTAPGVILILIATSALGVAAAQINGHVACDWRTRPGQMKTRLLALKRLTGAGRLRRTMGLVLVGCILTGGGLLAYAAEPDAPDRLPQEVVGVMGSGDQLSLKVAQGQVIKTVKLNEEYRDGWTLKGLTATSATLAKDGVTREVGLNPAGVLAPPPAADDPSMVLVAGDTLEARGAFEQATLADYWAAAGIDATQPGPKRVSLEEMRQLLGEARYQAFMANDLRLGQLRGAKARADAVARGDFNAVRAYDHLPVAGPDSFDVPSGVTVDQAAQDIGLPGRLGYAMDALASGQNGRGMVMVKCYAPNTPASAVGC
ncbi:MAG: hypothetical protein JWM33_1704 [Caulobacteraceae bacterium]|nr:hypothetical protein [Caulobacteraceae bacterium]